MAAARARSSQDPSPSVGEEPASLVSMRRALDGVMDDITNHSISTRSCFLNIWRRVVRVIDDHLQDEVEKESFFVTDEEDELDVEPPRDKIHKKKDKKDKKDKAKKRKVKKDRSRSPAESEDPDPPLNKKSRPGRLQHDDDSETKDALVRSQVPTASAPSESAKAVPPPPAACSAKAPPPPPAASSARLAPMPPPPPPPPAKRVPKVVPPCPKMRPAVAKMQCGS